MIAAITAVAIGGGYAIYADTVGADFGMSKAKLPNVEIGLPNPINEFKKQTNSTT